MADKKEPAAGAEGNGAMRIDPALVRELAELLTENALTEIEVEDGDRKIKVKREITHVAAAPMAAPPVAPALTAPPMAAKEDVGSQDGEVAGEAVKSPMVGTCYLSAEPGAKPFVEVGSRVTAGQTLLIIEAMKTMNQIPSPRAGTVTQILIEDGQPVEFGEPLAIIE